MIGMTHYDSAYVGAVQMDALFREAVVGISLKRKVPL
jgi:hypothetical protein